MNSKECAYVDTSALISRILAPKPIREKINEKLRTYEKKLVTSTYVVGEFKRTLIRDLIFLRNLIFDRGIEETLKRLSRLPRTRRISNIISILGSVILSFREYFSIIDALDLLRIRAPLQCFHNVSIVEDATHCLHANISETNLPDGHISIAFRCKNCNIVEFFETHKADFDKIKDIMINNTTCNYGVQNILNSNRVSYYCKKISDCIISVIAAELCNELISCNPRDFTILTSAISLQHINGCK
ncbi:MAG: hypothetical protein ACP6IU_11560 [Candidatus Asgardarchaeia archaeon]